MRRLALLALLFALPAEAGPIAWVKRHPVAAKLIFTGVAAGVYAEGLHRCRVVNVESCDEHYGAAWGGYGATVGLDLVAQLVGQKIGGKTGNAIAYGGSTAMLGWGAYQWHGGLNKPREELGREKQTQRLWQSAALTRYSVVTISYRPQEPTEKNAP